MRNCGTKKLWITSCDLRCTRTTLLTGTSSTCPYADTFSGSHQSRMLAVLPALLLQLKADLRHLARLDVDFLRLLAEGLVPHLDRLLARRYAHDLRGAAGIRDGEERG